MKILFSPSESKMSGGSMNTPINFSWVFPNLNDKRLEILEIYNGFLKKANKNELQTLFGLKKENELEYYSSDLFSRPLMKAILRYNGVAYEHLNYRNLDESSRKIIDENTIIFSNLYGAILAKDMICDYKLKQGETIGGFRTEVFYKKYFSSVLDDFLDFDILDLRAGFYEKFYSITKPHTTIKFLKNGKVVSHFAKAYRGIVLRYIALNQISSLDEFYNMQIPNLKINKIIKNRLKTEIIVDIIG